MRRRSNDTNATGNTELLLGGLGPEDGLDSGSSRELTNFGAANISCAEKERQRRVR